MFTKWSQQIPLIFWGHTPVVYHRSEVPADPKHTEEIVQDIPRTQSAVVIQHGIKNDSPHFKKKKLLNQEMFHASADLLQCEPCRSPLHGPVVLPCSSRRRSRTQNGPNGAPELHSCWGLEAAHRPSWSCWKAGKPWQGNTVENRKRWVFRKLRKKPWVSSNSGITWWPRGRLRGDSVGFP